MDQTHNIQHPIRIGSAGWGIPKEHAERFPDTGTHLERYARRLTAVEINSSFYRPHRPQTYAKWAASVPAGFRFAVKIPREITHTRRLIDIELPLETFLAEATALGSALGPLLIQLPPSLKYDPFHAPPFFDTLRARFTGNVVCEPRHATWFTAEAAALLAQVNVARVAADPALIPEAAVPGGWSGLVYYRLHGSPRIYYSDYEPSYLDTLADDIIAASASAEVWCIFDNTAIGHATANALSVIQRLVER